MSDGPHDIDRRQERARLQEIAEREARTVEADVEYAPPPGVPVLDEDDEDE